VAEGRSGAGWVVRAMRNRNARCAYSRGGSELLKRLRQSLWRGCLHSSPVRVDQVIPSLASRDAIGVHSVNLTRALRAAGIESDIFYGTCTPDMADAARPIGALGRHGRDRFLLYQASIGSPVFDTLMTRDEPKLVNYHNITPTELLASWEPAVAYETSLGRAQLERLASRSVLAVADSHYNELELLELGYAKTAVVPLLIDMLAAGPVPDPAVTRRLATDKAGGGVDLLFVGKVAPHKAPHDLVKMLSVYRRLYDPRARLRLVGSPLGDRYGSALAEFVRDLGLDGAVEVTGSVDPSVLEAYFRAADVFVCASEHEGFCVPIVEAMGHAVPVVAYGATAVPETVGDAGLVLATKDPLRFATAVHRVVSDNELRARLSEAAARRVERFSLETSTAKFVDLLREATGA
jgi:L-malate glycosyltransferase